MASFSKNTGSKYSGGMNLLHLRPAGKQTSATVQRAPASMPLPTAGGGPAPQSAAESPVSMPSVMSSAPAGTSAYPPKSERRPVVFDRSDGPSDFEKRLMANKKQKQEQEAKQRGPDRRRVRTERVEISSSDSKEVNRDFAPFESVKPTVSSLGSVPTIQREMLEPSGTERTAAPSPSKTSEKSTPAAVSAVTPNETIQRKIDSSMKQAAAAEKIVQRESLQKGNPVSSRSETLPRAADFVSAETETVQREMPLADFSADEFADDIKNTGEAISAGKETVQREPLKRFDLPGNGKKQSSKTAKPAVSDSRSGTVQRQSAAPGSPVKADPGVKSISSHERVTSRPDHSVHETVRREILPAVDQVSRESDLSVNNEEGAEIMSETVRWESLETAQPAGTHSSGQQGKTIQRETLKAAAPVINDAEQPSFPVVSGSVSGVTIQREELPAVPESAVKAFSDAVEPETVQRETLRSAEPVHEQSVKTVETAQPKSAAKETVQRETLRSAEPVNGQSVKAAETAQPESAAKETVQRETLRSAEPVHEQSVKTVETAQPESAAKETVQRETLRSAEPVHEQPVKTAEPAYPESAAKETIQRETLRSAEPVHEQSVKTAETAQPESSAKEMVQRETLRSAEPVHGQPAQVSESAQLISAGKETVRRETLRSAEPVHEQPAQASESAQPVSADKATVRRETLKSVEPVHDRSVPAAETAHPVPDAKETVQREPLRSAEPVHEQKQHGPESAGPAEEETVQREVLKSDEPVPAQSVHSAEPAEPVSASEKTIQRETLKSAEPIHETGKSAELPVVQRLHTSETVQRESLKTAVPVESSAGTAQMPILRREFSENHSRQEKQPGGSHTEGIPAAAMPVIQRESDFSSGDDLQSLLSSLPTHYEMPRAQVEAIRSGKNPQSNAVQREFQPAQPEKEIEKSVSAASPQSVIQREPDLVLPKQRNHNAAYTRNSAAGEPMIQREPAAPSAKSSMPFPGALPGSGQTSGNQNSSWNFQKPQNMFPGVNTSYNSQASDMVQREIMEPAAVPDTGIDEEDAVTAGRDLVSSIKDELPPEVTPQELDILADRLMPRIKRMMRAESERSIFR